LTGIKLMDAVSIRRVPIILNSQIQIYCAIKLQ